MSKNNKPNTAHVEAKTDVVEEISSVEEKVVNEPEPKKVESPAENKAEAKFEATTERTTTASSVKKTELKGEAKSEPKMSDGAAISVGDTVRLRSHVTKTVTGTAIPGFAHKNVYKVEKILNDRVILRLTGIGTFKLAVSVNDIVK